MQHGLRRADAVELDARLRGHDVDVRAVDREVASVAGFSTRLPSWTSQSLGRRAADRRAPCCRRSAARAAARASRGERTPAGLSELEPDRRRERDPRLARSRRERRGADARLLDAERQLDPAPSCARARRAPRRSARGRGAVEDAARLRGADDDLKAVADERGVRAARDHVLRDQAELIVQRAVQDGRRRRHVGAEDLHVEALEAADRAEAVALALRRRRRPTSSRARRRARSGGSR